MSAVDLNNIAKTFAKSWWIGCADARRRIARNRYASHCSALKLRPLSASAILFSALLSLAQSAQALQNTTTTYEYDAVGNLTRMISPLNTTSNPAATDYHPDALNRTDSVTQPSPSAGLTRPLIQMGYDGQDQVTTVDDPRLLITNYGIDGLGNRSILSSPDSGTSYETHDEAGNLISRTDARGIQTTYSYDALNRLSKITYATGTPTVFGYDGYGGGSAIPASTGKLTQIDDESGQTFFFYDDDGHLSGQWQVSSLVAGVYPNYLTQGLSYSYGTTGSAKGKPTSLLYFSGNQVSYSYDAAGRISAITLNTTNRNGNNTNTTLTSNLLTAIKYTPSGQFLSGTFGNHTTTVPSTLSRSYDLDGRVQSYPLGNATQGGTVRTLSYDAGSRITAMTHTGTGTGALAPANFNQTLSYDNLDRVTGYTLGTTSSTYSYDDSGNRLTTVNNATSYTHGVDLASNRVQNTSGPAPAKNNVYDQAGNLKSDGTNTYSYSDRGLMQSSTQGTTVTRYTYNGLGQRVTKRGAADTSIVQYLYDPQGHLIGEYDVYGNPIQETIYLGDIPIAVLTQTIATTTGSVMTDNSDSANVSAVGSWPVATTPAGFQGTNYQTHAATTTTGDSFTWKLNLPATFAGKFWIQARWPADASRAADASYTYASGDPAIKPIDQRGSNNTWVNIGIYSKNSGYPFTIPVTLTPSATGTVAADAVRTLPVVVTTNVHYVFADHLGTPRVITRASDNKIVWRWDQADPYGVKQPNNNPNPNALGAFTYNLRFPGQLYDPETGLYYNGHRYYEPDTGTYTQPDPIGLAGGINTYTYVGNNPLTWIDPLGLEATVTATPLATGGFSFTATGTGLDGSINGTFNTATTNFNQIQPGTYSVTPRPALPDSFTNWLFNRNQYAGRPTISNTSDWNTIRYPDGSVSKGAQIHQGRNGTNQGTSLACMVTDQPTYNSLNKLFQDNYNNGGVKLIVNPAPAQ